MSPRRYLRCLGQPALFAPTGEPIRFRTRKHLALLVYLAIEGSQPQRRDRLAEFLWPRVPLAEARHSLATALSVLRPRLGPGVLEATRDQVSLVEGHLELDLDRLAAGDVLGNETRAPLEVAGFLEGFDIPDAGEFGLWKDRQQARWLPAVMNAFSQGLERCRRAGDTRQIEQIADKMLALDAVCEDAVRAKMEVLAFAGDRLAALRLYEAWRNRIAEDLEAAPSAQLERMAARLRQRGWERASLGDLPVAPPDQSRSRPFIGRAKEYQALYDAWQQLKQGKSGHILLTGDSGVGKTRLVERLTTAASLDGAAITRVQCYELEREIPYATVSGLILGLLGCAEVSGTPPEALAELSRTVPDVRRRFPAIPAPRDTQGDTARIELAEAFHQLLQAIAEERPVILVVDDMHLADDASLSVLHLVARRAAGDRVMMILVARGAELIGSSQADRLRRGSKALGIKELELRELPDTDACAFMACLLAGSDAQPPADVKRILLSAAGGFPMVLELLIQDWLANGDESLALNLSAMTADLTPGREHPETYGRILSGIIRGLDSATQNTLYLAAILGPRLNDLALYTLADLGLGQTMAGLARLASLHILRDSGHGLEFVNELLRAQVYASVPSSLRRVLHGSIADRLLTSANSAESVPGLEIAWHCVRAGRPFLAIPHLLTGARHAMRTGAAHAAQRALETALPALGGEEACEATLLLIEALQEQGRWRESLEMLVYRSSDTLIGCTWQTLVLRALALQNLGSAYLTQLRAIVPDLLDVLKSCPDSRARIRAGQVLAYLASESRERVLAAELLELVAAIPCAGADQDSLSQLALTRGLLLYLIGDAARSREEVLAMAREVRESGTVNLVAAQLLAALGTLNMREARYEEASKHFTQSLEIASRLGIDTMVARVSGNLGLCQGRMGMYEEQLTTVANAPRAWGSEFGGFVEVQLAYNSGIAYGMRGESSRVHETIEDIEKRMTCVLPTWIHQAWLLWKSDLLLLGGSRGEAFRTAREALARFGEAPLSPSFAGTLSRWLALTSQGQPDQGRASAIIDGHFRQLADYDTLDQVEIICAKLLLEETTPCGRDDLYEELRLRVRMLPPSTTVFLRQMDILNVA